MILNFRAVQVESITTLHSLSNHKLPSDHCSRHPTFTLSCWSLHTNPEVFTLSWFFCYIFFLFLDKGITFSVFVAAYPEASSLLSDTTLSSFRLLTTLSSPFVSFVIFLPGFLDTVSISQPLFHNVHSKHWESFIKHRRLLLSSFMIDGNRFKTWFWSSGDMPVARNPNFKFSEDNRIDWLIEQTTITREVQVAFRNVTTCLRLFSPAN